MRRNRESLEELDEISDEEGLGGNCQQVRRNSVSDEEDLIENWPVNPDRGGRDEVQSQDAASTWSTVFKETEELNHMESKSGCFSSHHAGSEAKRAWKGNRGKANPKFSIHFQAHHKEPPIITMTRGKKEKLSSSHHLLNEVNDVEYKNTVQSMSELIEDFQEEKKHPEDQKMLYNTASFSHKDTVQSVAEIMGSLQQRSGPLKGASKMFRRGKRSSCTGKTNASSLDVKIFNEEHSLEAIDSGKSSEDETVLQDADEEQLRLATTVIKGQTVADRFLEAFDAAIEDSGQVIFKTFKHSDGYHGRLQQVIRLEKETNLNFLKHLQAENSETDQSRYIDVRILSRYLDAKLTVCECSLSSQRLWDPEMLMDNGERRIIIFSSKTCGDVELEIGNAIRVHHPWKEVALVEGGGIIILCTYFSSICITSPVSN